MQTSLPQSGNIVEPVASQDTTSLVNRLAGPSTGKAGLAQDQTEINRIIAEASKGSKFYYNEKKKDKDLTQRIEKILQLRDDILRGVDLRNVEHFVDRLVRRFENTFDRTHQEQISELESERDLSQTIVHVDMDAFYANVELLDNPDLAGKPFGVGHGMLCTASYEARKYGVRSGMPGFIATKLCPGLIFVPLHHSRYTELSEVVMSVLCRYDPTFFAAGCDEAYLNITNYCKTHGLRATQCVQELREAVFKETKLTASAGIAPTKMLAKICSDKNKPNGQFELSFDSHSILSFLRDLSIRKVPGVGRVNERLLESIGIKTCGDIFTHRATIYLMDKQFGSRFLFRTYLGVTSNVVKPLTREEKKSIGAERTFAPCRDKVQILDKLNEIAVELEKDMTENGWAGRTVTLKCKLDTYQVFTRAQSFHRWLIKKEDLFAIGKELIVPEFPLTVRLIGLRVTNLKDLRAPPDPVIGIKHFFESLKDIQCCKRIRTDLNHRECDADPMASHEVSDDVLDEAMSDFHETDKNVTYLNFEGHTTADDPEEDALISLDTTPQTHSVASSEKLRLAPHVKLKRDASYSVSVKPPSKGTIGPSISSETVDEEGLNDCPICGKTLRTDNQGLNSHVDFCLSRAAIRQAHAEATNIVKAPTVSFKPISKGKGKSKK
ncbi:hypothetical protein H2248_004659 [Termitomyces sp. 'cryptogamus']|nr:hypothetical protein H2248_004659 [Termitomyces sp. 'cryptogamus']